MISLEDCIAFSGLSEEEVAAIGEHEHISKSRPAPSPTISSNNLMAAKKSVQ